MIYGDDRETFAVAYDKNTDGDWVNPRTLTPACFDAITNNGRMIQPVILPNVLWYQKNQCIIWYKKPCRRKIILSRADRRMYSHPGLVFILRKQNLHVVVVNRNDPNFLPEEDSKVYDYPYRGTDVHSANGLMGHCGVRTALPDLDVTYCPKRKGWLEYEEAFYMSAFNYMPTPRNRLKQTEITLREVLDDTE